MNLSRHKFTIWCSRCLHISPTSPVLVIITRSLLMYETDMITPDAGHWHDAGAGAETQLSGSRTPVPSHCSVTGGARVRRRAPGGEMGSRLQPGEVARLCDIMTSWQTGTDYRGCAHLEASQLVTGIRLHLTKNGIFTPDLVTSPGDSLANTHLSWWVQPVVEYFERSSRVS